MFMIVFLKYLHPGAIIDIEIKLKKIAFVNVSTRFVSQCINTKQICNVEISLSGFYKSSTQNPSENWISGNWLVGFSTYDITGNE